MLVQTAFSSHGLGFAEHSSISDDKQQKGGHRYCNIYTQKERQEKFIVTVTLKNVPSQVAPSPVNPCLQVQLYEPSLLVQLAFLSHGLDSAEHSSISDEKQTINNFKVNIGKISQHNLASDEWFLRWF